MKRHIFPALLAASILLWQNNAHSAPAASAANTTPRANHVFIVSIDGGKSTVMQQSAMPTLHSMVKEGAVKWTAQTVSPSVTLVSHASMLTGVQPARHQISWNDWQPNRGMVQVPTIFALARNRGLKTAFFAGKEKLRHLAQPQSLDRFEAPGYSSRIVAAAAAKYIVGHKPNLCFVHFADPDGAGHQYGWGSPQQKKAFADTDAALRTLRDAVDKAGIAGRSTFIITADHGGHDKTHGTTSPEDMTIPWIAWGASTKKNYWIQDKVTTYDTAATALWLLGVPVPANWDGKPVVDAFN